MYARECTVDAAPLGDSIYQAVVDLDTDTTNIFTHLNTHEAATTGIHGATGTLLGTEDVDDTPAADTAAPISSNWATTHCCLTNTSGGIQPRVGSTTSSATPTINTDSYDCYSITALAAAITSFTTNLSGTPVNGQKLIIRIKDDGTGRAITWGAKFEAKGNSLPTTTTAGKVLTVGFLYDTVTSKWGCVSARTET
jgi:hypothetical protein